jgi:hypothetical protein
MSDPMAPWVPENAPNLMQDFNAAAGNDRHEQGRSRSGTNSPTAQEIEKPEMHLRPDDPNLVRDVNKAVDLEAQRRSFMKSPRIAPDDFGPKL